MGNPHLDSCPYCRRKFSEEEKKQRLAERRENARISREKAKQAGNSLGRKKVGDAKQIISLRNNGLSIREIAAATGCSTTAVRRRIKEASTNAALQEDGK